MKRRQREVLQVDLFPFLSVLACLMGSLMLITLSFVGGKASNPEEQFGVRHDPNNVPHLVIWDGSTILVTDGQKRVRVPWALAKANGGNNDTAFGELLRTMKADRRNHYLFIFVRPSGFGNFASTVQDLATEQNLRYGHWPIAQSRSVSLKIEEPEEGGGHG